MDPISAYAENLQTVQARIQSAAQQFQRPSASVQLLAVSKTQPISAIAALAALGQRAFGENYLQEALAKIKALEAQQLEWHFIGPIQGNKTRSIAEHFSWVHSVERWKIAERLNAQRPPSLAPLNICLQVNIDDEATKHGFSEAALLETAQAIAELPRLRLRGLMAIPAPHADFAAQRRTFARLRQCLERLCALPIPGLDTLSMGMSDDLEAAIAEGATIVRIGSALFGSRDPHNHR